MKCICFKSCLFFCSKYWPLSFLDQVLQRFQLSKCPYTLSLKKRKAYLINFKLKRWIVSEIFKMIFGVASYIYQSASSFCFAEYIFISVSGRPKAVLLMQLLLVGVLAINNVFFSGLILINYFVLVCLLFVRSSYYGHMKKLKFVFR